MSDHKRTMFRGITFPNTGTRAIEGDEFKAEASYFFDGSAVFTYRSPDADLTLTNARNSTTVRKAAAKFARCLYELSPLDGEDRDWLIAPPEEWKD